jgi:hypothetical protein
MMAVDIVTVTVVVGITVIWQTEQELLAIVRTVKANNKHHNNWRAEHTSDIRQVFDSNFIDFIS